MRPAVREEQLATRSRETGPREAVNSDVYRCRQLLRGPGGARLRGWKVVVDLDQTMLVLPVATRAGVEWVDRQLVQYRMPIATASRPLDA